MRIRWRWRRASAPARPPFDVALLLAQCAVEIRNTPNISNDGLLWQLDRARVFLNWIDERGGWNDELRQHFYKMMQFYG
jgi:hypothetical protein